MEVNTPAQPIDNKQVKKRIVKIKKKKPTDDSVSNEVASVKEETVDSSETQTESTESEDKDVISLIPSSRVKNYISKEKLNKELDSLIEKIKSSPEPLDLSTLLNEDLQSKIGSIIKAKEENKEEIKINSIAVDMLSKQKYKFSHTSFKVLSVFLDLMIEDLTLNVMDEIIKNKKSIINLKYVYSAATDSPLYPIYSSLPSFVNGKTSTEESTEVKEVSEESTEPVEETSESSEEESTHSINFEFYVRKICNKLKKNKEEYAKIKVSNNYQKFCSNLVLEFLDRVAPLTSILLEVMTTKTITNLVFETILKLQLFDNDKKDEILQEVKTRLN
jgi:hypothetical protein